MQHIAALVIAVVVLLVALVATSGPYDAERDDIQVDVHLVTATYTDEDVRFSVYYNVSDDIDPEDLSVEVTLTSYGEEVARSPRVEESTLDGGLVVFRNISVAHHDVDKESIGCRIRLYHRGLKIQTATSERIPWEVG